jgi:FkbM family methyltransferase
MYKFNYFNNEDYPIYISENTIKLTPHTFLNNGTMWEADSIKYFYENINKDKNINFVDIGAQSGLYTLLAKYLPNSTFYSFEPFTPTYDLLCDNIKLNNITNVKTYNIGLSDEKKSTILNTSLSHNGLHTIGTNPLRFTDINPISIEVDTLDNLFYDKDIPIDYIKMDTEGYEYFILKGGEKSIKKYKPFIQLEFNETNLQQCNLNSDILLNYIKELGYKKLNLINEELYIIPQDL